MLSPVEIEAYFSQCGIKALRSRGDWRDAHCIWHDDKNPSFSFNVKNGGWSCQAGCAKGGLKEMAARTNIPFAQSSPKARSDKRAWEKTLEKTYDYTDESGALLFQVCRFKTPTGKTFQQRQPDGANGWIWKMDGARVVPYRLPALLAAPADAFVYVVEGEKDADNLTTQGLIATTNHGGAGKWKAEHAVFLKDRVVVILPDNDQPGHKHAQIVAASLQGLATEIRIVELAGLPPKGDASDWIAAGGTKISLDALAAAAPPWIPPDIVSNDIPDIDAIRCDKEIPAFIKTRTISEKIVLRMHELGKFLKTPNGELFYFWTAKHRLIRISDDGEFPALLDSIFGLNPTEKEFRHTMAHIKTTSILHATTAEIRHVSFYDQSQKICYADLGGGRIARLDGTEIKILNNGTDGILFVEEIAPVEPDLKVTHTEELRRALFSGLSHDSESNNAHWQEVVAWAWFRSLLFPDFLPTRPILAIIGPKGSGKSLMLKRVRVPLYGHRKAALDSVGKLDDFEVGAINNHLLFLDNLDGRIDWLLDALAKVATGIRFTRRVLYSTAEVVQLPARCFLAITSRTPEFRREDVADRLLLIFLVSRGTKTSERSLLGHIENNRPQLWGALLTELNACIRYLREHPVPEDSSQRLADWATLAVHLARKDGQQDVLESALFRMEQRRLAFTIEALPLAPYLDRLSDGQWRTALEIWNAIGRDNGVFKSAKAVAATIRESLETAKSAWGLEIRTDPHTKIQSYRFQPRQGTL